MKRFRPTSIGSTLFFSLIAGMIVLGGCNADTLTGTTMPEEEEKDVTVQQATHNQTTANSEEGKSTDDPDGGHNTTSE